MASEMRHPVQSHGTLPADSGLIARCRIVCNMMNAQSMLKKNSVYYGWYIVIGLAAIGMVSTGVGGINFGLFVPVMSKELGISQVYFGWAYSARLIGFSATGWYIGVLIDRHGARIPMAIAGVFLSCIMFGLSYLQEGWHLIILYFLLGMIGLEGAGGNLYQTVPLSRWFVKKRGKAMAIATLGTTIGIFIFSPLSEFLIENKGWRFTWFILGCGGSLAIVLIALLIIRKDPQSLGLQPDGVPLKRRASEREDAGRDKFEVEYSWPLKNALKSRAFWAIVLMHGMRLLSTSTLIVFRIPFFIEHGISSRLVAWAISFEAIIASIVAIFAGRAVDRFNARWMVVASLVLFILTFIVTINFSTALHVFASTALYGASASMYIVAQNALWPEYFGNLHIGSIRGASMITTLLFSSVGAPLCGTIKDATGSYLPAWIFSLICLLIAAVLMALTQKPEPQIVD